MRIQVSLDEAESDLELRSLCEWLADDPAVGRSAEVSLRASAAKPGEMGLAFEAVQLIVDSLFQLSSLAIAIDGWRRAYAARPKITVERGGVRVTFATSDTDGARSILRALEELERAGGSGPVPGAGEGPAVLDAPDDTGATADEGRHGPPGRNNTTGESRERDGD
ncbi:hypothetical protein [Streptomyces sp. NPDC059788]|uniref:effector-associated constant component EACC1 n=1 Tax=Streptomyces sp. NPDC059788 TaxID=3346948 RepID=UPI0036541F8F